MNVPIFPHFKPLELEDRPFVHNILQLYTPEISEMTFTNIFIWRAHYGFQWSMYKDWFFLISTEDADESFYAFQPMGPAPRKEAVQTLLNWLREEKKAADPRIERAEGKLVAELGETDGFIIEPLRDHFDYVYRRDDLVKLSGGKYRAKRNHINQFLRFYSYTYEPLDERHREDCLSIQDKWCKANRCKEDLDLLGEDEAIREILTHFNALEVSGAVIITEGKVGAFTLGEKLCDDTALIHIEKADPEMPGLYSIINQQFCEHQWKDVAFINREQDLGLNGLREAKLSYCPDHFVEKYRIKMV